jgi:NADP-dependent aldehyde dehydrogenase
MDGRNIIGRKKSGNDSGVLPVFSPGLQRTLAGSFNIATTEEVEEALILATQAAKTYGQLAPEKIAKFLRAIADEIMALGDSLIQRAMQETALPQGRLEGERGRTVNQLRLFADHVEEGSWVEARVDRAQADRKPLPKADIRKMLRPLGPVVVFTASNFPLAFSTAGGDTASALAAGCPVIIKAHESHLGTNALVALAIQRAAENTEMPDGVFSSLNGTGPELGQHLVKHPLVKAIAFTGSHKAGKAIFDAANRREVPIPVFAEMGSTNPILLFNDALKKHGASIAQQIADSVTLGVGQFCTNPGLLIGVKGAPLDQFVEALGKAIQQKTPGIMLNQGICDNFVKHKKEVVNQKGVQPYMRAQQSPEPNQGQPSVARVDGADFIMSTEVKMEVFGPFTLVVECVDAAEMALAVASLPGQLTGTVMSEANDISEHPDSYRDIIESLQSKVGRILFNGVPTGVEVCHSMHHGGPYPATTDSRFTSVGTDAIQRFGRPLCYQDCPANLLPPALQDDNPLNIWRVLDGERTKDPV